MVRPELGLEGYLEGVTSVSKTTTLVLEGKCDGHCSGSFLWTLKKSDPDGITAQLTPDEIAMASKGNILFISHQSNSFLRLQ